MAKRFDALGLIGLVLLVAVWQLLTLAIPLISLPHPLHVAERIAEDFIIADYLLYYGLPKTGLLDSMLYTTGNVLIAVALGASVGDRLRLGDGGASISSARSSIRCSWSWARSPSSSWRRSS